MSSCQAIADESQWFQLSMSLQDNVVPHRRYVGYPTWYPTIGDGRTHTDLLAPTNIARAQHCTDAPSLSQPHSELAKRCCYDIG